MRFLLIILLPIFTLISSCNTQTHRSSNDGLSEFDESNLINKKELKVFTRYETPSNYSRYYNYTDFGTWLNNISLKNMNVPVYTFDEKRKPNPNIYVGVFDLSQPRKNVQFNENAIIRLRVEYFYQTKKYKKLDELSSIGNNIIPYTKYVSGDFSYSKYMEYLIYFLENTTSESLNKITKKISIKEASVGDIFFQNGNTKSHAVIIVDFARNKEGNRAFILAQGYYPSQDLQILTNPSDDNISPWYNSKDGIILTPEWRFLSSDLLRFK